MLTEVSAADESASDRRFEGIFSLVAPDTESKTRRLPGLFLGPAQLFADRDVDKVRERLLDTIETVVRSFSTSTYVLTPVSVDGSIGIYARDFYNRSTFRRKLSRRGMSFADESFVTFTEEGTFRSASVGEFVPRFVILTGEDEDPKKVVDIRGAAVLFDVVTMRLGQASAPELTRLSAVLKNASVFSAGDAGSLVEAIRSL